MNSLKAFLQLGPVRALNYILYQIKLRSGLMQLQSPIHGLASDTSSLEISNIGLIPSRKALARALGKNEKKLISQADEILAGTIRLFGDKAFTLNLLPPIKGHWTKFTSSLPGDADIKVLWETGRFGWASTLARAYHLDQDEKYAAFFWQKFEEFSTANPPNRGPHWSSAQEVALRLIALAFCLPLLRNSKESTAQRMALMSSSLAAHAKRIPISLSYSRAQDNNHLLSEALGLMTAAALLPQHPHSQNWARLGRKTFVRAIQGQIEEDGSYSQHSSNYQRLILQLGLWANQLCQYIGDPLPDSVMEKLAAATQWQLELCEKSSGQLANLGPNDGAYILPLTVLAFEDHRPVLQAASSTFLNKAAFPAGEWDEMSLWLSAPAKKVKMPQTELGPLRLEGENSWAYFRAAKFKNRPGHADQLHLDLWWKGINVARDTGSYLYTAPDSWNNALSSSRVHNTVTINGRDQMRAASRFLWLDWAQARLLESESSESGKLNYARASHNGYRGLGVSHERQVGVKQVNKWEINDLITSKKRSQKIFSIRLHWLLPDLEWRLDADTLHLDHHLGSIALKLWSDSAKSEISIIRAGELLIGSAKSDPTMGWYSPSYAQKEPALSVILDCQSSLPNRLFSTWSFPKSS